MLIRVFKSNQKIINVLTVFLLLLLWIPAFFSETLSFGLVSTGLRWLDLLLMMCLVMCQVVYLNSVVSTYKLIKNNSHLTSLIYAILNSCFLWLFELNVVVLSNTFVLLALHQLFRVYGTKNQFSISFGVGLLFGVAGLIYTPMFIYFILVWTFLLYTTTPSWRDFIVSLIGFCTPFVYYIVYKFIFADLSTLSINEYLTQTFIVSWESFSSSNWLFFIGLLIVLGLALFNLLVTISKSGVKTSRLLVMVLLMFVLGLGSLFLNRYDFLSTFLVLSIPMAIIIANFFQNMKKVWLAEVLFLYLLVTMVMGYFS